MNLVRISKRYHINKQLIMRDYFGFDQVDETEPTNEVGDELNGKLEEIRSDLARVSHVINGTAMSEDADQDTKVVPRALVALKYRVPMLFVSRLAEQFSEHSESNNIDFYRKLVELRSRMWQSRHDMARLSEIINESREQLNLL